MDTQDEKLIFYFPFRPKKRETISLSYLFSSENPKAIFSDNETVYIQYQGENHQIEIECYSYRVVDETISSLEDLEKEYKENNEFQPTESMELEVKENGKLRLTSGKIYMLSSGGDSKIGYLPGVYSITIRKTGTKNDVNLCFRVTSMISAKVFDDLGTLLESTMEGLSYDWERTGNEKGELTHERFLFEYFNLSTSDGKRNLERLRSECMLWKRRNGYRTENTIVKSSQEKISNAKTIRYSIMHPLNNGYYVLQKKQSVFTDDNIALERYVRYSIKGLEQYKEKLVKTLNRLSDERNSYQAEIDSGNLTPGKMKNRNELIKTRDDKIKKHQYVIEGVEATISILTSFLTSYPLNQIRSQNIAKAEKGGHMDASLYYFKELYSNIYLYSLKREGIIPIRKKSTMLFELYGLVIIDHYLTSHGYQMQERDDRIHGISEDSLLIYRSNENLAYVYYNHPVKSYTEKGNKKEGLVSLNSNHDTPDYILEIHSMKDRSLLSCLIFEMKYRPLEYIDEKSKSFANYIDYVQLGYREKDGKIKRGKVDQVFVVYPEEDEESYPNTKYQVDVSYLPVPIYRIGKGAEDRTDEILQKWIQEAS